MPHGSISKISSLHMIFLTYDLFKFCTDGTFALSSQYICVQFAYHQIVSMKSKVGASLHSSASISRGQAPYKPILSQQQSCPDLMLLHVHLSPVVLLMFWLAKVLFYLGFFIFLIHHRFNEESQISY